VKEVHSTSLPPGCSAAVSPTAATSCTAVIFNNNTESPAPCHAGGGGGGSRCICRDATSEKGTINGIAFNRGVCAPEPTGELLSTNNGICNISAYEGGLHCCGGGSFLLDADQEVPAPTDTWYLKYRFYFEEHAQQANLYRAWWSTEAVNNEYDVPQSTALCLDSATPKEECVHRIQSSFRGKDMLSRGFGCMVGGDPNACMDPKRVASVDKGYFKLIYAAAHCHAPSCESMELWDLDTNRLVCRNEARIGGGEDPMDEKGFVVGIPPCVWGSASEGLQEPPLIHLESNLTCIKRSNNTNGHWGVMSLWQARAAYVTPALRL